MYACFGKSALYKLIAAVLCIGVACAAIVAIGVSAATPMPMSASCEEWGLSFRKASEPPVPNMTAAELAPYGTFYCAPSGSKRLYITFDAGYENGNTAAILDALSAAGAKAAFFVVEPYIKENPELVMRMVSEGHLVCNHTHHHPNMSQKSKADFAKELSDVQGAFTELTGGNMPMFYRPPEGKFSMENLTWAQELGYTTVLWSLAYKDWVQDAQPDKAAAIAKIMSRTHDGAIVLLHSTSSTNAAIMSELLSQWQAAGYTFGTLDELKAKT